MFLGVSTFKKILINWDLILAGVMLCALVVVTFAGAFMRYLFSSPFVWLEEIQLFCQVWIVFAGGCTAFRLGGHVEVEFIAELLPEKGQKAVLVINSAVLTGVLLYLLVQSWNYLQVFVMSGRTTNILGISYVLIYGIAPVSILLMIVNYFAGLKGKWKEIENHCEEERKRKLIETEGGSRK